MSDGTKNGDSHAVRASVARVFDCPATTTVACNQRWSVRERQTT